MRSGLFLALALSLGAGACGFSPLYAPAATGGGPAIGPVIVDEVPGTAGYELKLELDKLFNVERGSGAARRLSVSLKEGIAGLGFRVDESATRSDLTLSANYILYDVAGNALIKGAASTVASYDVPTSAFGELSARDRARERAADQLAEQIRAQLALKLASLKDKKAS